MSIRSQFTLLMIVVQAIVIGFGVAFWASMARFDAAEASQRDYAVLQREVTSMRDVIFEYVATTDPAAAARAAAQAAFVQGEVSRTARGASDSQARTELERVSRTLADMAASARRLSLGLKEPNGAQSRAELQRGLYAQAADVSAGVEQLQQRAQTVTETEVSRVRIIGVVALVVGFVVTFGALIRIAARLQRGLDALTRGLHAFAAGDLDARIDIGGRDELSQTAEGFNRMAELVAEHDRELSDVNRRLIVAARTKSEFIANMSHDLRTPLNSIIGFSGVLLSGMAGTLDEEQTRQLRFINRSGKHLKTLVDDVLDLSRLESVGWEQQRRRFSVEMLVQDVAQTVHATAAAKRLTVVSAVEPAGAMAVADELGCRRILMNLASNAVKFTEKGSVSIRARVDRETLTLEVEDTGPGIAPDDRARIFEPFEQVRPHGDALAKSEGSGLGLAIVRRIVQSLGGTMALESAVGKGSHFTVRLPLGASAHRRVTGVIVPALDEGSAV